MRSKSLAYMPALDGLRGIAVLLVFAVHAGIPVPGGLGVDIFFVISGFLITRILSRELERAGTIRLGRFYARRILRLYPALLALVLCFIAAAIVLRGLTSRILLNSALALTYTSNVAMTISGEYMGNLSHTWSLAMEEQFYLVWPFALLVAAALHLKRSVLAALTAGLSAFGFVAWFLYGGATPFSPLVKIGALMYGCLLAIVLGDRKWQSPGLAYAALVCAILLFLAETLGWIGRSVSAPLLAIAVGPLLLHLAYGTGPLVRAASTRWLVGLGVISYGFYLWHFPVLGLLVYQAHLSPLLAGVLGLVISVLIALASYRWIESPALKLKDRFDPKPAATQTPESAMGSEQQQLVDPVPNEAQ